MALHVPKPPGIAQMLKEGARYFQGLEEAVFRNISACRQFAQMMRTAYGPNGMNKIVINHLGKPFVTNDAATIINEIEVEHPAVKLMIFASQMQEQEVGDGTNFVIIFCGVLLEAAESLLKMGLTPFEVTQGYELALERALEILPTLTCFEIKDLRSEKDVIRGMKTAIMSKQLGQEDFLTELIAKACISILPEKTSFNVDNIRVCKILGAGLSKSEVIKGMMFKRCIEGEVVKKSKAKIVVYTCPVDISQTETKGTVLIKTADELKHFNRGEESLLESQIKAIADTGVDVVVAGGKFGEMALHYMNKYNLMAVRLNRKFDVRRICKAVGATALPRMVPPSPEEMGYADSVFVDEISNTPVVVFRFESRNSRLATVVVRGSNDNYMDDIERVVDDGVNTYKALTKDGRFVPGAGATEIELARQLSLFADTRHGLDQYAIRRFANALEIFPKILAESTGVNAKEVISRLYAAHEEGKKNFGFDIEGESLIVDTTQKGIFDLYLTKFWALKYAVDVACTIIKIDQIIMAKRAGGPKNKQGGGGDEDDD